MKAWVVAAEMGLGHMRGIWPLSYLSPEGVFVAGSTQESTEHEKKLWDRLRNGYEWISRFKKVPLIGEAMFRIFDRLQAIEPRYPFRDQSRPNIQVKLIRKFVDMGLCDRLMEKIKTEPRPYITSFYATAIAADVAGYGKIYCVICDADIGRGWVAKDPRTSRIEYLAPCGNVVRRLRAYGVPDERIFLTGFPMPRQLTGGPDLAQLRSDIGQRLHYLDPSGRFMQLNGTSVQHFMGSDCCAFREDRVLTIAFCVGGAGAQKEIGAAIMKSLASQLREGLVKLNLVCGVRPEVKAWFQAQIDLILPGCPHVRTVGGNGYRDYFETFNESLKTTDILWTKPSELSFYCGLGIAMILAPDVGAQETMNRAWLTDIQGAVAQEDPAYTHEWLADMLRSGRLAEAAWNGFLKARCCGTFKIQELLETGTMQRQSDPLLR